VDQARKQTLIVLGDRAVEALLQIVTATLLHDRETNNLRITRLHPVVTETEPHTVRCGFLVKLVDNAVEHNGYRWP